MTVNKTVYAGAESFTLSQIRTSILQFFCYKVAKRITKEIVHVT